jgi:hypothetical protein
MSSRLTKVERRLVALRVAHTNDLNIRRMLHIVHGLWRNEDELAPNRPSRSLYNHFHAAFTIHAVHEHVTVSISTDLPQNLRGTYNSSRQRIGDPMASQSARRRQTVEYDFSPPDSVLVCMPSPLRSVMSGCTCTSQPLVQFARRQALTCISSRPFL